MPLQRDRLQPEGIFPRWNHRKRNGSSMGLAVQMFRFQPCAEAGIVDIRLALPKIRAQPTLDLQMIQLQLDDGGAPGKIAPDVGSADMQSRCTATFRLCFNYHTDLLFDSGWMSPRSRPRGWCSPVPALSGTRPVDSTWGDLVVLPKRCKTA